MNFWLDFYNVIFAIEKASRAREGLDGTSFHTPAAKGTPLTDVCENIQNLISDFFLVKGITSCRIASLSSLRNTHHAGCEASPSTLSEFDT